MDQTISDRVTCVCSYKCSHMPGGHDVIPSRTKRRHVLFDQEGTIHPDVTRSRGRVRPRQNVDDNVHGASSSEQPVEIQPMANEIGLPSTCSLSNGNSQKFYMLCPCSTCRGSKVLHRSTVHNHLALDEFLVRLQNSNNLNNLDGINMGFSNDATCGFQEGSRSRSDPFEPELGGELVFGMQGEAEAEPDIIEGPGINICQPAPTPLMFQDAILVKFVSLQSTMDDFKLPQNLQIMLLKEFFDNSPVPNDLSNGFQGIPLGRLLTLTKPDWNFKCNDFQLPTTWKQLNDTYKRLGMSTPQRWRLCTGRDGEVHDPHVMRPSAQDIYIGEGRVFCHCFHTKKLQRDCNECSEKCPKCKSMRKDILAFDYMPLGPQIASLCKSHTFYYDFLNMWRHNDRWMNTLSQPENIVEFWDGQKVQECSYFCDPATEWELPVICPYGRCKQGYIAFPESQRHEKLVEHWNAATGFYNFNCEMCHTSIQSPRRMQKGDPRNLALMGHWDGFQAATTTVKDCWTLEIMILNGGKQSDIGPIPILFIPISSKMLFKSKRVNVLQAFLLPFVEELQQLYVNGIDVYDYAYPSALISPHLPISLPGSSVVIRAMLMMFTADHPAQCKIGGFKDGGYEACRRDHMACRRIESSGTRRSGGVEYPLSRKQKRFPPALRTTEDIYASVKEYQRCGTNAERKEVTLHGPISGGSPLWQLYHLYRFDLSRDLVFDTMHILALCVFKKYVEMLVLKVFETNKHILDEALDRITKIRPGNLGSRWPHKPNSRLGYWKAEEYTLFIKWCLPHVLDSAGFNDSHLVGAIGMILLEIARLFYSHSRTYGWTQGSIHIARELLATWRIKMEEALGPNSSPLEHVAGNGDIFEDILRHGCHDVFWCYAFEREVSSYVNISSNQKKSEVTYTLFHARVWFSKVFKQIQFDHDNLYPPQRALNQLHGHLSTPYGQRMHGSNCLRWHENGVIQAHSQEAAKDLWSLLKYLPRLCPCASAAYSKGIIVGRKQGIPEDMTESVEAYLKRFWRSIGCLRDDNQIMFDNHIFNVSFIVLSNKAYRPGDFVVVKPEGDYPNHDWSWKCKILQIFTHQCNGRIEVFFQGEYFLQIPQGEDNHPKKHKLTNMVLLKPNPGNWGGNDVRLVRQILHRYLPFPYMCREGMRNGHIVAFEYEDVSPRQHLLQLGGIGCPPPYPVVHDVVLAKSSHGLKPAIVRDVRFPVSEIELSERQIDDSGLLGEEGSESENDADDVEDPEVEDLELIRCQSRSTRRQCRMQRLSSSDIDLHSIKSQDSLVGQVLLTWLSSIRGRPKFYHSTGSTELVSWHLLVKIVDDVVVTKKDRNDRPIECMLTL